MPNLESASFRPWSILLLFAACGAPTTGPTGDTAPAVAVPADMSLGDEHPIPSRFAPLPLVEPHICAHPTDASHLLAAAMVVTDIQRPYESCRLSSFVSRDAGATWTETAHDSWDYDPWTAMLGDGQAVLAWIGTPGKFRDEYPIQFFRSADGGVTWSEKVQTIGGNHDGTKLAVGNGEFWFTTVQFVADMATDIVLCRARGAEPFVEVARVPGQGQRLAFCEPAVLADGTVLLPAARHRQQAWVQALPPGGDRLSAPRVITERAGGAKGYMRLCADTSPVSRWRDRCYFVRALGSGDQHDGVWLNVSADGGATWSEDARVDRFPGAAGGRANLASAVCNRRGVLGISWIDAAATGEAGQDVWFAASADGGATFSPPLRVSSMASDPRTEGNGDVANKFPGGGHYMGIAARADGEFQLIWSDSRNGRFALWTRSVRFDN
ncbi:MAG: exo-alpha-sialidase [Planctomycetes bacterium]|nr:exo-alpha-sialidase [Planctomycetota bacterium]